jgi:hypothetical protein
MTPDELTESTNIATLEQEGVAKVLRTHFSELISLGPDAEKNVCRVFRDYLISTFGLSYFNKLNLLVKKRSLRSNQKRSDRLSRWIDSDVMERFEEICDTDVFDNRRSLSALAEVIFALHSSLANIAEEDISEEADYIFDMPYRFSEIMRESYRLPKFYAHSFKREEAGWSARGRISLSDKRLSISYAKDLRR